MVGGSGPIPEARAAELRTARRVRLLATASVLSLLPTTACVYFNTYYNADRLFEKGLRQVEEGRPASARADLQASIEKAERIVQEKPNSRWADDALLIVVRARLMLEDWEEAAAASRRLLDYSRSRQDSVRAAGYLGTAELKLDNAAAADTLLTLALGEDLERERRSELLYARALARWRLGRLDLAQADLQTVSETRPEWVEPRLDQVRLLVERGLREEAAFALTTAFELELNDADQALVVRTAEFVAEQDPAAGLLALASVENARLTRPRRAQLLKVRGDLRVAGGSLEAARADYRGAAALAPDDQAAANAQLYALRLDLEEIGSVEEFRQLAEELKRLAARPTGQRSIEVRRLSETFARMEYWLDVGRLGYLIAAERARDLLAARRLAQHLFLLYAEREPESAWAPKAILAALDLGELDSRPGLPDAAPPPDADELRRRLREEYSDSPYVRAVLGETSTGPLTFEELETGLRRQLERLATLADQQAQQRGQVTRDQ
ncbi:MAG: hypothetical protein JSU87_17750 [Gemmatimonadota bacterium]|nr:MAG: hypothetical protein JSU87_17750 [Gemmatimonadota bacterium]